MLCNLFFIHYVTLRIFYVWLICEIDAYCFPFQLKSRMFLLLIEKKFNQEEYFLKVTKQVKIFNTECSIDKIMTYCMNHLRIFPLQIFTECGTRSHQYSADSVKHQTSFISPYRVFSCPCPMLMQ